MLTNRRTALVGVGLVVGFFILFAAAVAKFGPFYRHDLQVQVINVGDMELSSVVVKVSGAAYEIGPLVPGKRVHVAVVPTSESSIEVKVRSLLGDEQTFVAAGYIERGWVGDVTMEVAGGRLINVKEWMSSKSMFALF